MSNSSLKARLALVDDDVLLQLVSVAETALKNVVAVPEVADKSEYEEARIYALGEILTDLLGGDKPDILTMDTLEYETERNRSLFEK